MSNKNDIYDISKYTDEQLYDILDISNPTDRELEAKILHLIRKYTNIQNEDGDTLRKFFEDIYDHFFQSIDNEGENEEEDETESKEGFANMNTNYSKMANEPETTGAAGAPTKENKTESDKTKSQLVTTADYVPDSLRLNPLLKQTIKRIICIDSQYRDVTVYPNTNNFAFDLSEPLRDVVSLKLYSIQIPYTWYTISKSYGSNFFYLKGTTDGINNGNHDYKIDISAGNYDSNSIVAAVNKGFAKIFKLYPDTNFNSTNISYATGNSITTITIDIEKVYTESYYSTNFTSWTPSTYIVDTYGNTVAISDVSRNTSIPCYLGFNYNSYSPNCIYSKRDYRTTISINSNSTVKQFYFDNSNNYFTVIQYIGPQLYDPNFSTVTNTFKITLYDTIYNTRNPVISNVNTIPYIYSRSEVTKMVNDAIANSGLFTSDSNMSQYDISGNVINANNTCFQLKLMFDRNKVLYKPNSNMLVIFPTENHDIYNNTTIWTYQTGISCFYFNNVINDFSIIHAELPIVQSNFKADNAYVYYHCRTPYYMVNSANDFSFNVPKGDYTLDQYINVLNTSLNQIPSSSVTIQADSTFSIVNSKLNCVMNFSKNFTETNYMINYDETSVLCSTLHFTPTKYLSGSDASGNYPLSISNMFDCSFSISYSGYLLDSSYVFTILPKPGTVNQNEPARKVYLPGISYSNYTHLLNSIQSSITQHTVLNTDISNIQFPYSSTTIIPQLSSNNVATAVMTVLIKYYLSESNYIMSFYPTNTNTTNPWYTFGLDISYNLYEYGNALPYAEFTGSKTVNQNEINITTEINSFTINANYDPLGGAYTSSGVNDITITIPPGKYTTNSLCNTINKEMNKHAYTYGSYFYTELDSFSNLQYVKLILNVNRIYTSADYNLVFYDPFSFASCNSNQGIQKTTWDTTLGWILGYRDYTSYQLKKTNQTTIYENEIKKNYYLNSINSVYQYTEIYNDPSNILLTNSIVELSSDTTLTTTLYNYFVISLDDYNQNHINDGLVTITRQQTSIQISDYASIKICDPVTGKLVSRAVPQSNSDNLTSKQLYSVNQSNASQNATTKIYSAGPYIKDLFAYVPIKPGTNGTYFIEYGGGLQAQERLYFGPVNIRKMSIQLMNDRGDFLDLNGSNWSFSFICEQLYRSGNSSANK